MTEYKGRVLQATGGFFYVDIGGTVLLCTLKGSLKLSSGDLPPAVVGDFVLVTTVAKGQGVIREVLPRRNVIGRSREFSAYGFSRANAYGRRVRSKQEQILVANVDQALLVFAVANPHLNLDKVDLMLVEAFSENIPPVLCFNKMDLAESDLPDELDLYKQLAIDVFLASAVTGEGLEPLRRHLEGRVTVLWGPSGVGKSTILNALWPELDRRVRPVSEATGMGRHTTVSVEMIPCGGDTWVVDAPGWRHFRPRSVPRQVLNRVFPEIAEYAADCHFPDCRHRDEPGCAVRRALEEGRISRRRFSVYISLAIPPE